MIEPLFETNLTLAKRSLIAFHDFIALTCVAAICSMALIEPAYAYVDPSVMTYTIQALAGVAVALGAVAGVAFRRTRKVLFKMLKIDENRGKTAEQDILRLAKDDIQAHKDADDQVHALTTAKTTSDLSPLSWKNRLIYALISAFFFVFTLKMYSVNNSVAAKLRLHSFVGVANFGACCHLEARRPHLVLIQELFIVVRCRLDARAEITVRENNLSVY